MKNVYIYDLEQFANFHSGVFYDINRKIYHTFVIHKDLDQRQKYLKFLKNCDGLIGFNNINYDYPLLHCFLKNPNISVRDLYKQSQRIIKEEYPAIRNPLIKQLDLMRIWHFNNKARMTSLKKLQCAMRLKKIQDLPLPFYSDISKEQIDTILEYNKHDVDSTYKFYLKSKNQIELRKSINKMYNINTLNSPEAGIGEKILLAELSKGLKISRKELNNMRTHRDFISFKDCVLSYIEFKNKEFSDFLDEIKNTVVEKTKNSFKKDIIYKGFKYCYGTGKLICPFIR